MFVGCSVKVLLLNICNTLELSGLFVCPGGGGGGGACSVFQCLGGQKKLLGWSLLGGISTQADTMSRIFGRFDVFTCTWKLSHMSRETNLKVTKVLP